MIIKSGRNEFLLNEKDVVMDNGSCIQLITRRTGQGWNTSIPVIAKRNWTEYKKHFELVNTKDCENYRVDYYKLKGAKR